MRASEVMIKDPIVAAAGATSAEVAALMRARDISVVPVVDNPKDRRYLGTISDRDIVTRCVALGHDPTACSAETHARTDTAVVAPETEMKGYKLPKTLDPADSHVRATIVVLDKDRKVVGFIPHPEDVQGVVVG
jgi:CBS domain-containing protein